MYNTVGTCQVGIEFEFLDTILTDRGVIEDSIAINQFLRIKDLTYLADKKMIVFDCDVYEHLLN